MLCSVSCCHFIESLLLHNLFNLYFTHIFSLKFCLCCVFFVIQFVSLFCTIILCAGVCFVNLCDCS